MEAVRYFSRYFSNWIATSFWTNLTCDIISSCWKTFLHNKVWNKGKSSTHAPSSLQPKILVLSLLCWMVRYTDDLYPAALFSMMSFSGKASARVALVILHTTTDNAQFLMDREIKVSFGPNASQIHADCRFTKYVSENWTYCTSGFVYKFLTME